MSKRIRLLAIVVFFQLFFVEMIQAQIKVIEKPAPEVGPDDTVVYTWTSSWGFRDDPRDKYPLGTATHKTKSEAVAAANAHIARTAGNGGEAVTHYLIVGEPSVRLKLAVRAEKAKEVRDKVKQAKKPVEKAVKDAAEDGSSSFRRALRTSERQLADVIIEYKDIISESYKQATEAKKTLTGNVSSLSKEKLKQVNDLIDQYNRELEDFRSVMGKDYSIELTSLERFEETEKAKLEYRSLIGDWQTDGSSSERWEFKNDGTVTLYHYATISGKVFIDGNTISFETNSGFNGKGKVRFRGEWDGEKIVGEMYHFNPDGKPYEYKITVLKE